MCCLGIDLGNVIIDHLGFGTTSDFFETGDYSEIPPVPGLFESLKALRGKFGDNIFIVYKATDVAEEKILSWLEHHQFCERTGICLERIRRTVSGRNKYPICQEYGATHFIDDRLEVLSHLIKRVDHLFLFRPQQEEVNQFQQFKEHVHEVSTWEEATHAILNT